MARSLRPATAAEEARLCAFCGAGRGERCTNPDGSVYSPEHAARRDGASVPRREPRREAKICSGCAAIVERGAETYPDGHWEGCPGGEVVEITPENFATAERRYRDAIAAGTRQAGSRHTAPGRHRPEADRRGRSDA